MAEKKADWITFERSSFLPNITPAEVWEKIGTWAGVNYELSPLFGMTYPNAYARLIDVPVDGVSHFTSTILLFGVLPVDRHRFSFVALDAPHFFEERSSNFNMCIWTHKRTLFAQDGGVLVADKCSFVPRMSFMGRPLQLIFSTVFAHRHNRLARLFAYPSPNA